MKVRLLESMASTEQSWNAGDIREDLPDEEASRLVERGIAEWVSQPAAPAVRAVESPEKKAKAKKEER
jgi:hypothetical protein